jgi:ubiquinone/menaquinone biosynthesis C-methylase UbiE
MNEYYKIKDCCRQGLVKHLEKVCCEIPRLDNCNILDIGCGTGVPTLWFSENFPGIITAVDSDNKAINYLQQKVSTREQQNRINAICQSFDEFKYQTGKYNIILAEGFLNVVGFEYGLLILNDFLVEHGFIIIHDEYKDHNKKLNLFKDNNFTLIKSLLLAEDVWWNDYYKQLETEISRIGDFEIKKLFKSEIEEIQLYKTNPTLFQSIYYIAMKI